MAKGMAKDLPLRFQVVVEGPSRELHAILRDEIYRIGREAVRNAISHAQASRIEVEISYGERALRVRVRDDGRGIDQKMVEEGRAGITACRGCGSGRTDWRGVECVERGGGGHGDGVGDAGGDCLWDGSRAREMVVAAEERTGLSVCSHECEHGPTRIACATRRAAILSHITVHSAGLVPLRFSPESRPRHQPVRAYRVDHPERVLPGTIFAMAQTPDGYLWLGGEFGLFRFDGVHGIPWQPPAGQHLPDRPYACSSRATALFGLARLPALRPGGPAS